MKSWASWGKVHSGEDLLALLHFSCAKYAKDFFVHREVYRARSKKSGAIVALKKILMHHEKDGVCSMDW